MNIVVMGICGCGKSTIGERLARELGWAFIEGDQYHCPESIERMSRGIPLTDTDRQPWLDRLSTMLGDAERSRHPTVLSCSALKRHYRETLAAESSVTFIYLHGERHEIERRMSARQNHFMVASMVDSQLETLEEPTQSEPAIRVEIDQDIEQIVQTIIDTLNLAPTRSSSRSTLDSNQSTNGTPTPKPLKGES